MKTGKQLSKYYTYSIIWANKIIAEVDGYSIDKAYAISPLFGSMVEKQIADYKAQLDRLKYTAMVFGVFDECKSMFDKFYETNKKDINFIVHNPKRMGDEWISWMLEKHKETIKELGPIPEEQLVQLKEGLAFNAMWDEKFAYVMQQIGNLSLEKTKWLPSCYANIFKEQHKIVNNLTGSIKTYNKKKYLAFILEAATDFGKKYLPEDKNLENGIKELNNWTNKVETKYAQETQDLINAYESNMQLLEKIRREDFYD